MTPLWKRVLHEVVSNPRSVSLAILGFALLGVGVYASSDAAGTALIVLGAGVACLGILLPAVQESQIGPSGFTLKTAARPPDEQFVALFQHELEHAQRLALYLTGDSRRAAELASDAFARTFANWNSVGALDPRRYVVCVVTRLSLAVQTLRLVPVEMPMQAPADDPARLGASLKALLSIPPRPRAVALLHHYEALGDGEIAEIMGESADQVRARLREAETLLAAVKDAPIPGP